MFLVAVVVLAALAVPLAGGRLGALVEVRLACGRARRSWSSGRHQFDLTNGWEGHPPASDHVVVVSHRPRPTGWHPEASYHFATSVEEGIARAQELAGEGD